MNQDCAIYAVPNASEANGFELQLVTGRFKYYMPDDSIKLEDISIPFAVSEEVDMDNLRTLAIKTLQDKQKQIMAEAQVESDNLQLKINSLLLLTHDGG